MTFLFLSLLGSGDFDFDLGIFDLMNFFMISFKGLFGFDLLFVGDLLALAVDVIFYLIFFINGLCFLTSILLSNLLSILLSILQSSRHSNFMLDSD